MSDPRRVPSVIDAGELRSVAAASGGSAAIVPDAVTCEALVAAPAASATVGVWRIAHEGWSTVLKVLHHGSAGSADWQAGGDESHWYYWRREALAFQSGLLDDLGPALRAPRCFGVFDRADGTVALWLEDLSAAVPATAWSIPRYREAATALGGAQGAVACRPLPGHRWLARRWLRDYVERRPFPVGDWSAAWSVPLVAHHLPPSVLPQVEAVYQRREQLLAVVEALPQTLCHSDLHPANLFASGEQTVLIDWAMAGLGGVGEDPANLVYDAVLDFAVRPEDLAALDDAITTGYLEGLVASGCELDPDAIRRGMRAARVVKYAWILPAMVRAAVEDRPLLNRRPIADGFAAWASVVRDLAATSVEL